MTNRLDPQWASVFVAVASDITDTTLEFLWEALPLGKLRCYRCRCRLGREDAVVIDRDSSGLMRLAHVQSQGHHDKRKKRVFGCLKGVRR